MIVVIDNYDSFVHNLARHVTLGGAKTHIVRNDITLNELETLKPDGIVISPGPCTPNEAGICVEAVKAFGQRIPILGVCLGHQCIAQAYGGTITKAEEPMHGKTSSITHNETGIFNGLPSPLTVGRYHSLAVSLTPSSGLDVSAFTEDGEIMAIHHRNHTVYGVQFHP
jgi:para-aminobenzoate synthetase component 2